MQDNDKGITSELVDDILNDVKLILDLNGDDDELGNMTTEEIANLIETYL